MHRWTRMCAHASALAASPDLSRRMASAAKRSAMRERLRGVTLLSNPHSVLRVDSQSDGMLQGLHAPAKSFEVERERGVVGECISEKEGGRGTTAVGTESERATARRPGEERHVLKSQNEREDGSRCPPEPCVPGQGEEPVLIVSNERRACTQAHCGVSGNERVARA